MSAIFGSTELESIVYDLESQLYTARFDRSTTAASMAAVAVLSDVMGVEPTEMNPLGSIIDTDALDSLVDHPGTGDVSATFPIGRYELTVSADGIVTLAELDRSVGSSSGLN